MRNLCGLTHTGASESMLLSPQPGSEGSGSPGREPEAGTLNEGPLLLADADVHAEVMCPSQRTLVLLFSTQARDRRGSL